MNSFNYHEQKETQTKFPHLGHIVWWQLRDIHIERDTLRELFEKHNFKDYLPPKTSPQVAIKRAINKIMVDAGATRRGLLIRNIITDPGQIVYGVVSEFKNIAKKDLEYHTLNKITVSPGDNSFVIEYENDSWPCGELEDTYREFMQYHNTDDLRSSLLSIMQYLYCTAIRESGGVYFIGKSQDESVFELEKLVPEISNQSRFYALQVIDTERAKNYVLDMFRQETSNKMENLLLEVMTMKGKRIQARSIETKRSELSRIEKELTVYKSLLGHIPEGLYQSVKFIKEEIDKLSPIRTVMV